MRRQKGRGAPGVPGLDRRSPYEALSLRDIYRINEQSSSRSRLSAPPPTSPSITGSTTTTTSEDVSATTTFSAEEQTRHLNADAKIPHDPVSLSVPTAYTWGQPHGDIPAIGIARPLSSRDLRALGAQKARAPLPTITSGQTLDQTSPQQHKASLSDPTPSLPRKSTRAHPPVSLVWGAQHWNADAQEMESPRPRPNVRPGSAGSIASTSGRSSFDSRAKSPLSTSSSVDSWETSRTSVESIMSNGSNASVYQRTAVPMYAHGSASGQAARREQMAPMPRYVPGTPTNLITPPRLGASKNGIHIVGAEAAGVRYTKKTPGEGFKKLPEEILLVILTELRKLHLEIGSLSCATCWMRDCCNLGLSCKKWWSAAKRTLYEDIQLVGSDSVLQTRKKYKVKYGTRLRLLRRTLRDHDDLAGLVKVLKVPLIPEAASTKKDKDEYLDLVASTIMACPNLERLPGFYPAYKHEFNHFVHALSTRTKLVEQVWVIDPSPFQRQHRLTLSDDSKDLYPALAPGALLPEQCLDFLSHHSNWDNLQTLFLHCNPGGTVNSALFTDITMSLPSLQHLHVSSFPSLAFNDDTLVSLPPLKSLRLESLSGITSNGLSTFVSLPSSNTLTNLSLISLPLLSLPVLARVLSRLRYLEAFTISQSQCPSLPPGEDIFMHPYLASLTLKYLHWEITSPLTDMATEILTKSIQFQGFPSLRRLRAPADFDGTLQALCKPRGKIELPGDRYRNITIPPVPSSQSMPIMPMSSPTSTRSSFFSSGSNSSQTSFATSTNPIYARSLTKSPTKSRVSLSPEGEEIESIGKGGGRSLAQARRQAQARIEAAEKHPQFHIILWDEEGHFVERHAVGGFVGQVQSKIFYSLKPDVEGMDEAVARVSVLLDSGEETTIRDGCTGSWNISSASKTIGGKFKSSGKERWSHTERGRWREVNLKQFF